jgi:hypothetical protein
MQNPQSALKREEKNKLFKKGEAEAGTVAASIASEVFCTLVTRILYFRGHFGNQACTNVPSWAFL